VFVEVGEDCVVEGVGYGWEGVKVGHGLFIL